MPVAATVPSKISQQFDFWSKHNNALWSKNVYEKSEFHNLIPDVV